MKKLNIKRLAAIGAGAVLLGAAASAAFTDLTKTDIVNSTGVPQVSIVGGSNAAISDFVWAGNIATKVAQLATKTESVTQGTGGEGGTPTDLAVTLTVGGRVTLTGGVRELNNNPLSSASSAVEYYDAIGNSYFRQFANTSYTKTIDGNATTSFSVVETIGIKADGKMDVSNSSIKDLVATLNANDMNYTVTFSPGIAYSFSDTGSDDYIPIALLGQKYTVDSIDSSGTNIVLVKEGAENVYSVGDSFTAVGRDGKTYTIRFDGGGTSGTTNKALISLRDSNQDVQLQQNYFNSNSDIIFRYTSGERQGQEILVDKPRLTDILSTTQNQSTVWSFKVISGTNRLELKEGYEVPYDSTSAHTNMPWTAAFTRSSSTTITQITIKNTNYYFVSSTPLYSVNSLRPAGKTTEFEFFKGTGLEKVGTFKYEGFYDAGVQRTTIKFLKGMNVANVTGTLGSYGGINYYDTSGVEHKIPMAFSLNPLASQTVGSTFKFDGVDHVYWTDSATPTRFAVKTNYSTINPLPTIAAGQTNTDSNVAINLTDTNWSYTAIVYLQGLNSKFYRYLARKNVNSNQVYLVLAGRDASSTGGTSIYNGVIDSLQYNAGDLFFLGTSVDDANVYNNETAFSAVVVPSIGTMDLNNVTQRPYYYPDTSDFNIDCTGSCQASSTTKYKTAIFRLRESVGSANTTFPAQTTATQPPSNVMNIYIDTTNGNGGTVDTVAAGSGGLTGYSGKTYAIESASTDQNLTLFSEYLAEPGQSGNYSQAYTLNGTLIKLLGREVTVRLPDKQMKSYFTLASSTVSSSIVGGENIGPLSVGERGDTNSGTSITVNDITGSCAVGSGACMPATYDKIVPVDSLVYTDEATPTGKVIIVGGYFVNSLATSLTLSDGSTLQDALTKSGDYVAEKLENGDIVVAGYTATDTGRAAQELIDALDALLLPALP